MTSIIKNKKGSVLLMTLLILSGILVVVLSASQIVDSGIKTGRIQSDSTKAYFAAEAGIEDVLWKVRSGAYTPPETNQNNIFPGTPALPNGATYQTDYAIVAPNVFFTVAGSYKSTKRSVQVSFEINPPAPVCDNNGTCDTGEDCANCAADCGCILPETCQSGICAL